jgi:hypothetical protein
MIELSRNQSLQQDLDEVLAIIGAGASVLRTGDPRRLRKLAQAVKAAAPRAVVFLGDDETGRPVLSVDADAGPRGARLADRPADVTDHRG